jgi:GNAT superfamily N-acetyltransferase
MSVTDRPVDIVSGQHADPRRLAATIAAACGDGPLWQYLVPDPQDRTATLAAAFALAVEHAQRAGTVCIVEGSGVQGPRAVAVWRPRPSSPESFAPDLRLAERTGRHAPRFLALSSALHASLLAGIQYQYLEFLAVRPEDQGKGLGTCLLGQYLAYLDVTGQYAVVVATQEAAQFYSTFGFAAYMNPVALPHHVALIQPMLRPPRRRSHAGSAASRTAGC